jgi:hypothetical protein
MNNNETYTNTIELLKQALKFYAEPSNYITNRSKDDMIFSLIEMDSGAQARFTLNTIKELNNLNQQMQDEFDSEIKVILAIDFNIEDNADNNNI